MANNNSAYEIVRAAYEQVVGADAVDTIDTQGIVDAGVASSLFETHRDQFTKALIEQCAKTFFTDEKYTASTDPFFVDERRFANILQIVSAEAPEVQESHAWKSFVSGTSTAGSYTLFLPILESRVYSSTVSWELPIAITDEQWDDSVRDGAGLDQLVDYIILVIQNAVEMHRENMTGLNRNNFMAEKILYANSDGAEGIHVVNLMAAYNAQRGKSITTVAEFLASPDALRFAEKQIELYAEYLRKPSKLFNTSGALKFVPKNRLVLQMNTAFLKSYEENALSVTFNDRFVDFVNVGNYDSIPVWQGFGVTEGNIKAADFSEVSKIDIETANGTVTQSGIVGFLCDKWAILHTIRKQRTAVTRFDPEAITQYYYQNRDAYCNNLGLPAVVFVLDPDGVNYVSLSKYSTTIAAGDDETITATTNPAGATVTWVSSDTSVATVNAGEITGVAAGDCYITASINVNGDVYYNKILVTVTAAS